MSATNYLTTLRLILNAIDDTRREHLYVTAATLTDAVKQAFPTATLYVPATGSVSLWQDGKQIA